jgi:hypothetical protein
MKRDLTHALDECLALLREERATLEECLARYPECASGLRPLLELARELQDLPQPTPSPAAFTAGKQRMLDALVEKRDGLAAWKRTPAFRLALAGALALALFALGGSLLLSWPGVSVAQMATLDQARGAVELMPAGSDTWRPASSGEQLEAGSQIRTGPLSAAKLVFFDGSTTDLEAEVAVAVVQMNSRRDGGKAIILLRQTSGQTRSHVRRLPDQASRFEIRTPTAVVAVRGTEFTTTVETDGTTSVAVAEGLVEVTARETTVAVPAGQRTVVQPERPPSTPALVPPAAPTPSSSRAITSTATATATCASRPPALPVPNSTPQPPGLTKTPQPPGLTKTPQPPGLTKTPQPPGHTKTPQPPGHTKTPQPPGHTKTPQPPGQDKKPEPPGQDKKPKPTKKS